MWKFFKGLFIALGIFMFLIIVSSIIGLVIGLSNKPTDLSERVIVSFDLDTPLTETRQFDFATQTQTPSIHDVAFALDKIAKDDRVVTVAMRLSNYDMSFSQLQELERPFRQIKEAGKNMYIYSENYMGFGAGNVPYAMATLFDEIWMQPTGALNIKDVSVEMPFINALLTRLGITPEFSKRADYKTAPETFLRDGMSEENREMTTRLVNGLNAQVENFILTSRPDIRRHWETAKETSPMVDETALQLGFIDRLGYFDEFEAMLDEQVESLNAQRVSLAEYSAATADDISNATTPPQVAFIVADGMIPDPSVKEEGDGVIAPAVIEKAIDEIIDNDDIKYIIIRINSPGGAPSGAETIRRALERATLAEKKVYVSMGSVAASGGYWAALSSAQIFATPATLTGSIGVYGGKFHLQKLWPEINVNWEEISSGQTSHFTSMNFPFTEQDKKALETMMDHTYDQFLTRVSDARRIDVETLRTSLAGGRVWLGSEAAANGLIDKTGGILDVISMIKKDMGLREDNVVTLVPYPEPKSALEELLTFVNRFMSSQIYFSQLSQKIETSLGLNMPDVKVYEPLQIQQ